VTESVDGEVVRGGRVHLRDLTGLEIRDCEVSGLKIVDCWGREVSLGGAFGRLVVNDVDVTAYVEAELDRRHPERARAREARTPEELRSAWTVVEGLWADMVERARRLPEAVLHERVDGEWSFVETQRHLLFASDAWIGNAVLEEASPYHPWGMPAGGTPEAESAGLGLAPGARPSLTEVLAPRRARAATVRRLLDGLAAGDLDRVCGRRPAGFYPDEAYIVGRCLRVVLTEEAEHHRYAVRDLAVIEARA